MMGRALICDRCGKFFKDVHEGKRLEVHEMGSKGIALESMVICGDLCPECSRLLGEWRVDWKEVAR